MSTWLVKFQRVDAKVGHRTVEANNKDEAEARVKKMIGDKWAYKISVRLKEAN